MNEHDARTDPTTSMLRQILFDNDEKHEEAHKRLRYDWRDHDRRIELVERDINAAHSTLRSVERMVKEPRDISTLRLTPGQTAVVITVCLTLGGLLAQVTMMRSGLETLQRQSTMQDLKLQSLERMILTNGNLRRDQP